MMSSVCLIYILANVSYTIEKGSKNEKKIANKIDFLNFEPIFFVLLLYISE